jgi:hypothetical protein
MLSTVQTRFYSVAEDTGGQADVCVEWRGCRADNIVLDAEVVRAAMVPAESHEGKMSE